MKLIKYILAGAMLVGAAFGQGQFSGGGGSNLPTPASSGLCLVSNGSTPGAYAWGACSGAAATAFSAITGATNTTAAMVVGTGASLTTTGSGSIVATDATGTAIARTGVSNTFTTGTQDFSGVTLLKARLSAGLTTTVNGDFGYDTTNKNWHFWANGVDNLNAVLPVSITPANNDCVKWTVAAGVITLNTAGAACGSGGGGVTSFSGDGVFASNSSSTGGVTLTLNTVLAHKYWGNPTGSTAAGSYSTIVVADLPGSGATTVNGQSCVLNATCTIPFQTNGGSNTSQAGVNFLTSTTNSVGLTVTPVNSATNAMKFEITGASYTGNAATATSFTGNLVGDVTGPQGTTLVARINGTTVPTSSAADQFLATSASGSGTWLTMPPCADSGGNHINFTHAGGLTCGTTSSSSAPAWNSIVNATGALSLSNAGNATTFNQTSAVNWTWANTTSAVHLTPQNSPIFNLLGTYFNATSSATDTWTMQVVEGTADNGPSTLTFAHSGTTGAANATFPGGVVAGTSGGLGGSIDMPEGTALSAAVGHDNCYADSTSHNIKCSWNNGSFFPLEQNIRTGVGDIIVGTTSGVGLRFAGNTSGTLCLQENSSGVASWAACGGSVALSGITAATAPTTLANGNNGLQIWNWAPTTNQNQFQFGETTAATSGTLGSQYILSAKTLLGSTAVPLGIISSINGSQTLPSLHITPTWNTTGVVDAAILVNVTNTASGAASKLADFQIATVSQWNVDKAGVSTQLGQANAPTFLSTGTTAGFYDLPQGTTSAAVAPCNTANSICEQAPAAVTSYVVTRAGAGPANSNSAKSYSSGAATTETFVHAAQTVVLTGSAYTNATTSFSNVASTTNLNFALDASTAYAGECYLVYSASAVTAGPKIQFTGPASPTALVYSSQFQLTATPTYADSVAATAFSTSLTPGTAVTNAVNLAVRIHFGISNGVNAGTLQLQAASQGTGTVTIQPGSYCRMQ